MKDTIQKGVDGTLWRTDYDGNILTGITGWIENPHRYHAPENRGAWCDDRQLKAVEEFVGSDAVEIDDIFDTLKGSEAFGLWSRAQFKKRLLIWVKLGAIQVIELNGKIYLMKG